MSVLMGANAEERLRVTGARGPAGGGLGERRCCGTGVVEATRGEASASTGAHGGGRRCGRCSST